jgi:hypothetical protein
VCMCGRESERITCPSGLGSSGNAELEKTGAVASSPSGEKKLLAVNSVNTSSSRMPNCITPPHPAA